MVKRFEVDLAFETLSRGDELSGGPRDIERECVGPPGAPSRRP
jgi:hypothetical protein